jgi:hypothetical protein
MWDVVVGVGDVMVDVVGLLWIVVLMWLYVVSGCCGRGDFIGVGCLKWWGCTSPCSASRYDQLSG